MGNNPRKTSRKPASGRKRHPETASLDIDNAYQNLSLDQAYKEFTKCAQEIELLEAARACFEADYLWLSELPKACSRQELDIDYNLDLLFRRLRSRRPSVRENAEEILEELAENIAEWDSDFAELYDRRECLHEERIVLEEFHIEERKAVGIKRKFPAY